MKLTSALCASAAIIMLAGCAYETPAPAIVATTAGPAAVYYDQYYGPVYSGYWGADGLFHYQAAANGPWLIDNDRHFRRDAANGFAVVTITPAVIPPG